MRRNTHWKPQSPVRKTGVVYKVLCLWRNRGRGFLRAVGLVLACGSVPKILILQRLLFATSPAIAGALVISMKGVVIFDVDGTLHDEKSSWRLLYSIRGQAALSDQRFAAFEAGNIDYERLVELTIEDLRRLKLTRHDIDRIRTKLRPRPEAVVAIRKLKEIGWEVAAVSAGVCNLIDELVSSMGIALRFCNSLEFDESGIVCCAKIAVNPTRKDAVIDDIRRYLSLPMEAVVTVGDHTMDFSMFRDSGHYLIFDGGHGSCDDGIGGHISSLIEVPDWIERWESQGKNLTRG